MGEFDMSINGARKKTVTFNFERNTEHKTLSLYPKGSKKPAKASNPNLHSVPVDLEEKALVKAYLENEVEQYQGYVLMQYINNQDGSYQLKFADPATKERYLQTFTQEGIDDIIAAAKKLHSTPSTKPN